ncbi:MAG: helix-turn-helix transcriptional regulator [Tepidanaerobacteraceae bacterium]|nr:helix-turn-helix transcriptional regulator [Tepidanaerobacteraceae bacterium]
MFRIKELREKEGLTQENLAMAVGISRIYLCKLENGQKLNPSIPLLKKIAKVLNTTVKSLILED